MKDVSSLSLLPSPFVSFEQLRRHAESSHGPRWWTLGDYRGQGFGEDWPGSVYRRVGDVRRLASGKLVPYRRQSSDTAFKSIP